MHNIIELVKSSEEKLTKIFKNIDHITYINSKKVLDAFHEHRVTETDFNATTGYGYNDVGRDKIERIYASIFKAEDALVRNQFISGSHALSTTLFALLRPNDILLSITGKPYDTLDEVIGITPNSSSLMSFGVKYMQIDLIENEFDYDKIKEVLSHHKIKVIEIQRSKGYSTRKSIGIESLEKVIKFIRLIDKEVIIMIDNCYCEFVSTVEPIEVGADIAVGSLIKNLGGGIANNGAYVVGKENLIELVAQRLTLPGEGREVGPSLGANKLFLQGLYMAPSVVSASLKTVILASKVMQELEYQVDPLYDEQRTDIVQTIIFNDKEKLIKYCQGIQKGSAIDAFTLPIPYPMPGYDSEIIMASGSFVQGSSIELSCDGPMRSPYIAYMQGSLTYEYGKLGLITAIEYLEKNKS